MQPKHRKKITKLNIGSATSQGSLSADAANSGLNRAWAHLLDTGPERTAPQPTRSSIVARR